ncbi:hypothetical protein [Pseudoalteromonas sp. S16_S37]|uniref:hypothetical protein n=1 Tax=Pseudoalteromonas sp. S16_S37 TaxID=2720228 RepID=UPI0016805D2C|nr:hypothetical protein [Pseudoalteromonas sp. S16_S37]MBD1584865.1 hypothetical protein [Pseudoalteromonas sp. S16_S37]
MSELLNQLAVFITVYIGMLILWFLVTQFPVYRWRLFFARKEQITSLQQHEMYSCFITVVCFFLTWVAVDSLEFYLLTLDFGLNSKIKTFYLILMAINTINVVIIFLVHKLSECLFSGSTRACLYMLLVSISVSFMQLIARGYYDYHELKVVYKICGWVSNLVSVIAMSLYPIRQTLAYFNKEKEASG